MSPETQTTIRLGRGLRRHATSRESTSRTACGRAAESAKIAEASPDCRACLRVIRAALREDDE